jgi:hypothetical protein
MKPVFRSKAAVVALLALALAASGCGKTTSPTSPETALTQDAANDVAVQTNFALDQLGLDVDGALNNMGPMLTTRPAILPLHAAWDTTVTFGGLTATVSRNFYDADNVLLPGYGLTAVKMTWLSHIWGTTQTPRDTATVQHHSEYTFLGIQPTDTLLINGTCADTLLNKFHSLDSLVTRCGYWRSVLTLHDVRFPITSQWPLSGTLTYVAKVDRLRSYDQTDVATHLSVVVVITFNGTSQPDVVINGTFHYKWDMANGTMIRA